MRLWLKIVLRSIYYVHDYHEIIVMKSLKSKSIETAGFDRECWRIQFVHWTVARQVDRPDSLAECLDVPTADGSADCCVNILAYKL